MYRYIRGGKGHGNPLQFSCLENPMDRGDWWSTVHRVAKSWTQLKRLRSHRDPFGKAAHVIMEADISPSLPPASQSLKTWAKRFSAREQEKRDIRKGSRGLPLWLSGEDSTGQGRGHGLHPWSGKTMPRSSKGRVCNCWACALELVSRDCWAHVLRPLRPTCLQPVLRNEKQLQWEAHASNREEPMRTTTRESPCSNEDPGQPKINLNKYIERKWGRHGPPAWLHNLK